MKLRLANIEDSQNLIDWRNDPLAKEMSINQDNIDMSKHLIWLDNCLKNENILLYIAIYQNSDCGAVRFNKNSGNATVSINLNPQYRGAGLAVSILSSAISEMRKKWTIKTIIAKIKTQNIPSIKIFEKCGFKFKSSAEGILIYEK